jgi:hypothetical protein
VQTAIERRVRKIMTDKYRTLKDSDWDDLIHVINILKLRLVNKYGPDIMKKWEK